MSALLSMCMIAALIASGAPATLGPSYEMTWHSIDSGGALDGGAGDFALSGTVGQCDAGAALTGGPYALIGGFWPGTLAGTPQPGDCDGDGDVDLTDFGGLAACMKGPFSPAPEGCTCFDLDGSGTADLLDFAEFQVLFTGTP